MDSKSWDSILSYVDQHIYSKISLNELSNLAGYTPFYFSRLFSETMGMPATAYIRIRKLQHAISSLLEGKRVLDVALLYAFDSHEGFTRAFTQLFGSTPSTVRKYLTAYTVPAYAVPTMKGRNTMDVVNQDNVSSNLHQLVFEFLKESLEEARTGFCTEIEIVLLPGNKVKIRDNGRGLPLSNDVHASKAVLDKILAGNPITNLEYSQMGDLIQPGLQTVNSLCKTLTVIVCRNGCQYQQDYVRGIAQHELNVKSHAGTTGTEIILQPDAAIFGDVPFSREAIDSWLKKALDGMTGLTITVQQ